MTTGLAQPKRKVTADEAREVAEAAREQEWAAPSFVRDLFLGKLRMVDPSAEQDPASRPRCGVPSTTRTLSAKTSTRPHRPRGRILEPVIQRDLARSGSDSAQYGGRTLRSRREGDRARLVRRRLATAPFPRINRSASRSRSRCSAPRRRNGNTPAARQRLISAFVRSPSGVAPIRRPTTAIPATRATPGS